jgi:hypothetical protein
MIAVIKGRLAAIAQRVSLYSYEEACTASEIQNLNPEAVTFFGKDRVRRIYLCYLQRIG